MVRGWMVYRCPDAEIKDCPDTPEGVYDEDCPELEKLGVRYLTEEEMEEQE